MRDRTLMPTLRMAVALAAATAISTAMPQAQGRGGGGGGQAVICTPETPASLSLRTSFHESVLPDATSEGARFGTTLAARSDAQGNVIIAVRARHDGAGEPNLTFWSFDGSNISQVGDAVETGFQAERLVAANLDGDGTWPEFIASGDGSAPVIYAHDGVGYAAAAAIPAPPGAASGFGEGLAVGDLDGDGTHDLVAVGASGTVSVYSPGDWQMPIDTYAGVGYFGRSVALGDVDYVPGLDLIVGAETAKVGKLREAGQVYVLSGNNDGTFFASQPTVLNGTAKQERFGSYVGSGITADSTAAPEYLIAATAAGQDTRAVVYQTPPGDGTALVTLRPDENADGSWAQEGFASGDLDFDGNADVLIGAPTAPQCDGFSGTGGRVYLFLNYDDAPLTITSPNADVIDWDSNQFGWGKAIVGNLVVIGQPGDQGAEGIFRWGTVHIYEYEK